MSLLQKGENIGQIIAKVQDDLQYLRAAATRGFADGERSTNLKTLDMVITRTEEGLQAVAEKVLQSTHDHIGTLPAVARTGNFRDVKSDPHRYKKHRRTQSDVLPDLSAGQFCLVKHMSQLVGQPSNPLTNKMLADYYELPLKERIDSTPVAIPGQILIGSTVNHLATLPKSNRRDPLLTPPPISHTDACKGLLSLLERGLIPPAAEIVLSPPPIQPQSLRLHTPSKQHIPQKIADGIASQLAGVKLDSTTNTPTSVQIPSVPKFHSPEDFPALHLTTLEIPDTKPDSLYLPPIMPEKKTSSYKLIIQNGHLVDGTRDFSLFKKEQQKQWRQILSVLKAVVKLCRNYAIPLCIIDSNRLVTLSMEYELGLLSTKEDLLAIMINRTDILGLLSLPGQRYKSQDGRDAAVTKIAATYHMFKERKKYLDYRRRKWAAGILSMAWLTFLKIHIIKEKLKQIRLSHVEAYRSQTTYLRKKWSEIQSCKRTIIHIASQGYSQPVRASIHNFQTEQSLQMGRLCDIEDPNVEVIYVSPRPLGEEMMEYQYKLLAMGPAGDSAKHRVHFVSPEKLESFKSHNMALSSSILYSPACLSRIKCLIAGREAYIVSGTVCKEDLAVAYELGVPLLGSEPGISHLYSTKAGARRLLKEAGVSIPPYKTDIFSLDQLYQSLAFLIANNPLISRWLFKLPEQVKGRGFAYCDVVKSLPCYEWVVKEAKRYGSKWTKPWAQEQAITTIASYLPTLLTEHAHVADTPQWEAFLVTFLQMGGIIEGVPPSDSITPVAVDILIEPTGQVKVLCSLDQVCSERYEVLGGSTPQTSVPHCDLMKVVDQVATACKARGILGHLSIDFLTFIDPASMDQMLWCVDLDLTYSNNLALYRQMHYLTGFQLDVASGTLMSSSKKEKAQTSYYAILVPHLYHTNLSPLYHSIFFQMCKAHYIGYDPNVKLGTVFNLVDDQHREYLGMICIQNSLLRAVQNCSSNLSIIHQEVSTTSMQGHSNFKVVTKELDKIIELINSNR